MKIYLAGPMRGLPGLNFLAFEQATIRLRDLGHEVTSPAEKDIEAGFSSENQRPWIECACEDALAVLQSEAIALLPGWERSRGTRFEVMAALAADNHIEILDAETLLPIENPLQKILDSDKPKNQEAGGMRVFSTGATRNLSSDKPDFDGFLSPLALDLFAGYMHKHRFQADGTVRASDNWQKGIPLPEYMKSAWRHFFHWWSLHRGYPAYDEKGNPVNMEDTLAAMQFNVQGYAHEYLKAKTDDAVQVSQSLTSRL